jgi:hypothetical protein
MTEQQFRDSPLRQELAEFLSTTCGQHLLLILTDSMSPQEIDPNAAASAWIAAHERNVGKNQTIQLAINLSQPVAPPQQELRASYGVPVENLPSPDDL